MIRFGMPFVLMKIFGLINAKEILAVKMEGREFSGGRGGRGMRGGRSVGGVIATSMGRSMGR